MRRDSGASVYEFFAGGGMARAGLEPEWRTVFANDMDLGKAAAYRAAYPEGPFDARDVFALSAADLPGQADLAWASFPCQDLSLAGPRQGLDGGRSAAFWGFWRLIEALEAQGRAPRLVALENVVGLATSKNGADFAAIGDALARCGYHFGALELDARLFTPQSRPRLFIVASKAAGPSGARCAAPDGRFHTARVEAAQARLPPAARARWAWWRVPAPAASVPTLADIVDWSTEAWHPPEKTARVLALMAPRQRVRLERLRAKHELTVGALFLRVRTEGGVRRQRAEARFDGLAGCLRTPAGGSSRQVLIAIEHGRVRTRLFTPREGARLMGLPDAYPLPASRTAALRLLGDGVAAPVVRHLSHTLLLPLLRAARAVAPAPA